MGLTSIFTKFGINKLQMKKPLTLIFCAIVVLLQAQQAQRSIFNRFIINKGKLELIAKPKENTPINEQRPSAAFQKLDSIVKWQIDNTTNNWKMDPYQRFFDYVYDANNYITSSVREEVNFTSSRYKEDNSYDASYNLSQKLKYSTSNSIWNLSGKEDYNYNSSNSMLSKTDASWYNNVWNNTYRYSQTYNTAQYQTSYLTEQWLNNTWTGLWRWQYTYNASNRPTLETSETYTNNAWRYDSRTTSTYDANNNRLTESYELYENSIWKKDRKSLFSYNASNIMVTYTYQSGNASNAWQNEYKETYQYDIANNPVMFTAEEWTGSSWLNSMRATFTVVANNITTYLVEEWTGSAWVKSEKANLTYNSSNRILSETWQSWTGTTWVNESRTIYTYDANGNETSYTSQDWIGSTWKNSYYKGSTWDNNNYKYRTVYKNYNSNGGPVYSGDSSVTYYKTVVGLNESSRKENSFAIYPNPNNGHFTINTKENSGIIDIYNIYGAKVYEGIIQGEKSELNLSTLPKGIYIMTFSQGKTRQTHKIVIE